MPHEMHDIISQAAFAKDDGARHMPQGNVLSLPFDEPDAPLKGLAKEGPELTPP